MRKEDQGVRKRQKKENERGSLSVGILEEELGLLDLCHLCDKIPIVMDELMLECW